MVPHGIRDGQLRHLETLRVRFVNDWSWLLRETTASLRSLHFRVSHGSSSWLGRRDDTDLVPQDWFGHATCLHITKFTNLVSLFIDRIDMWKDEPVSFLAMLSNLAHLETLHFYSISNTTCVNIVSPI